MVKVFLFESATDGLTYLQRCCEHSSKILRIWASEGIERFMQNNCPALAKNAYLFTAFWNLCLRQYGLKPLPNLFCYFMNLYKAPSPWAFESALKLSPDNDLLRAWLQAQSFGTIENFAQKQLEPIYDQIIIYGNLPHIEMQQAISVLERLTKSCIWLTFHESVKGFTFFRVPKSESLPTLSESFCFETRYEADCFLKDKSPRVIVEKNESIKIPALWSAWLDWQQTGLMDDFLHYQHQCFVEGKLSSNAYRQISKLSEQAFQQYFTDDLKILGPHLNLEQRNPCPENLSFSEGIDWLKNELKNTPFKDYFFPFVDWPLELTRDTFFKVLKQLFAHKESSNSNILTLQEAQSLPSYHYYIERSLQEVWEGRDLENSIRFWENQGCKSYLVYSLDESLTAFKEGPLLKVQECVTSSIARNNIVLFLPNDARKLSCKAWERLKIAPWQTYFRNVLKVQNWNYYRNKTDWLRYLGEWVHAFLQVKSKPETLEAWESIIQKNYKAQYLFLKGAYHDCLPSVLEQYLDQSLFMAILIARACWPEIKHYSLWQSECALGQKTDGLHGRMDLFLQDEVVSAVVDYKTQFSGSFTPTQINQGHGLQIFLYGLQILKQKPKDVALFLVKGNGDVYQQSLCVLLEKCASIIQWMNEIQCTGFVNIPSEKENGWENLPLSFIA